MKLNRLRLWNFRNYHELDFSLSNKNLLLVGANGQGKSNFLEAIYLLAFYRSYRVNSLKSCINHGQNNFTITGNFEDDMEVSFQNQNNGRKQLRINNERQQKLSQSYGNISLLVIAPEDLQFIDGAPAGRRKFIDTVLSFLDKAYYQDLVDYQQVIKQRNETLKKQALDFLDIWDDKLVELSHSIFAKRQKFIERIAEQVEQTYDHLGYGHQHISVEYKSDLNKGDLAKMLVEKRPYDLMIKKSSLGIHHDDFILKYESKRAGDVCSQGQKRALAIALKLTELELKKQEAKVAPIILMDDTLLELDKERSKKIIDKILSESQIIATGTEKKEFHNQEDLEIVEVKGGQIFKR